ncbi:transcriptional regulator MntR [Hydrogenibacillus sp. N12]|nr:transcriptional regulator MntR [Hydrogenibacillus sp. N12]
MEDYLEQIFTLIKEKGYARVADIAEALEVHPSSVTKMIQKLDKSEYLKYEKYRGFVLTPKGKKLGKRLVDRHAILEEFLRLIGVPEADVVADVEGMEHHVGPETLSALSDLVQFLKEDPKRLAAFREFRARNEEERGDGASEGGAGAEADADDGPKLDRPEADDGVGAATGGADAEAGADQGVGGVGAGERADA